MNVLNVHENLVEVLLEMQAYSEVQVKRAISETRRRKLQFLFFCSKF